MTWGRWSIIVAALFVTSQQALEAQHPADHSRLAREAAGPDSVARFLQRARDATARYRDRQVAISDGYRVMGPEFPGMGEHWINLAIVFGAHFDAARPAILEYATIDGAPTLVGVAYALPLLADETPPDFPSAAAWHAHRETVDDEARLVEQISAAHAGQHADAGGARLAMLHAWIWLDNPDGPWAANNWSLPFARAHVIPPRTADRASARALSLLDGGADYYATLFLSAFGVTAADSAAIRVAVDHAVRRVHAVRAAHASTEADADEVAALRSVWHELWTSMRKSVTVAAWERATTLARSIDP